MNQKFKKSTLEKVKYAYEKSPHSETQLPPTQSNGSEEKIPCVHKINDKTN